MTMGRPKSKNPRSEKLSTMRVTPAELRAMERAAARAGHTLTDYRRALYEKHIPGFKEKPNAHKGDTG